MRNRILNLLVVSLFMSSSIARADEGLRKWEGEVFAGGNVTIGEADYVRHYSTAIESKSLLGYTFGGEVRRNLDNIPLDLGLRLSFSKTGHDVCWAPNDYSHTSWNKSYNNAFVLAAVGDWNFNRGGLVSPFVGAGVGVALNEYFSSPHHLKPFVMPRIGVGINDRVRLSVSANISEESQNTMMLTVGYMFGSQSRSRINKDKTQDIPPHISKLMRQSNACLWSGVGTLCLGAPSLAFGIAIIGSSNDPMGAVLGGIITGAGGLLTLSSVPLFIVSQKKKNEALRLAFKMSAMSAPDPYGTGLSTPGVGISLAF